MSKKAHTLNNSFDDAVKSAPIKYELPATTVKIDTTGKEQHPTQDLVANQTMISTVRRKQKPFPATVDFVKGSKDKGIRKGEAKISQLQSELEALTRELQESRANAMQIRKDWQELKEKEKERTSLISSKEAQTSQVSKTLMSLASQQLEDRKEITHLTEQLEKVNQRLGTQV